MEKSLEECGWKGTMNEAGGQKVYKRIQAWDRKVKKNPTVIQPMMKFTGGSSKHKTFDETLELTMSKLK